ncbi:MAG: hypothetical protein E7227_05930 [Clostridiales bacterium]|nr:hypothetical protein [Clostridiales bacterium]
MRNKKGSSAVLLAILFLGFAICLAGAIGVSRRLVVSSECETFGRLWTKAVLSEYDVHLMEDYSMMAYFGNDDEVTDKLNAYLKYSAQNKLDASIKGANADLTGFELGDPSNFRKAMELGFPGSAAAELISGSGRTFRDLDDENGYDEEGRIINDRVVLDTLPSHGMGGSLSSDVLTEKTKSAGDENGLVSMLKGAGAEVLMIEKRFDNHVTKADDKNHLFVNEWEYIINGSPDDEENYIACRRILFIIRNALNLLAIYSDPEKVELIITVAESITPGPLGIVTQAIIAEAWAALETEEDLKDLYDDGRVPVIKTPEQWKTGLGAVLDSTEVMEKLDDESKELLEEKKDELSGMTGGITTAAQFSEGLNYDEYLMIMIMSLNDNVRLLRIMDLVQINMKYRYYRDFNLMEYYTGTRFTIEVNGKNHEFEDAYK